MKLNTKLVVPVLASTLFLTAISPTVQAFEGDTTTSNEITIESKFENIQAPSINELEKLNLSDAEIQALLSIESTGIYLVDGVAYDKDGNKLVVKERGKLSWATKILRAGWDKLPKGTKDAIGGIAGFEALLNFIDHYTGAIEDAVYEGCLMLGMGETAAWWVTKTLTLLVL